MQKSNYHQAAHELLKKIDADSMQQYDWYQDASALMVTICNSKGPDNSKFARLLSHFSKGFSEEQIEKLHLHLLLSRILSITNDNTMGKKLADPSEDKLLKLLLKKVVIKKQGYAIWQTLLLTNPNESLFRELKKAGLSVKGELFDEQNVKCSPLTYACLKTHNKEWTSLLIKEGADVHGFMDEKISPLYQAFLKCNYHIVSLLLDNQADPVKSRLPEDLVDQMLKYRQKASLISRTDNDIFKLARIVAEKIALHNASEKEGLVEQKGTKLRL